MATHLEKQLASAGKFIGGALDQLELDKRLSAVEKKLGGAADKVGMADQRKMLGIPMSRKKPDWGRIATVGAAAVGAVAAGVRYFSSNGDDAESESDDATSGKGQEAKSEKKKADTGDKHVAKDHKEDGEK